MSEVKEHSVIYLSPSDDPEREWCQDDVWEESVRYNLGADFDRVTAERDALQALLTAADERVNSEVTLRRSHAARIHELNDTNEDLQGRADVLEGLLQTINAKASKSHISQSLWRLKTDMANIAQVTEAALKPVEGGGDDTTLEEDREDFKKVFVRTNTKQGQSISLADMIARYEKKP